MRNHKGFTIIDLAVTVVVISLLASVALPKFYRLTLRAEALSVQGVIGTMRSALSMQMARGLYQGEDLAAWAYDGTQALYPMKDLLLEQPKNYLGVLDNSDQLGSWYDDKQNHELVYVVRYGEIVNGITGTPKKVRWKINVIYDDRQPQSVETLQVKSVLGLVLQPATQHQWLYE